MNLRAMDDLLYHPSYIRPTIMRSTIMMTFIIANQYSDSPSITKIIVKDDNIFKKKRTVGSDMEQNTAKQEQ